MITDTELKLIARAATIGLSNSSEKGKRTPAAMGTPIVDPPIHRVPQDPTDYSHKPKPLTLLFVASQVRHGRERIPIDQK